jgi:type IV pilus assembly protein PilO
MKLRIDGSKITNIRRKYRILFMVMLCVGALAAIYFTQLVPQFDQRRLLAGEYENAQQELARLTAMKNGLEASRREYARLKDTLETVVVQMPEEKDVPNLLRQVSMLGQEAKLRVKFFEPKPVQAKDFYMELPFEVRYAGGYHNVGYFFDGIRKLDRIVHMANFSIESKVVASKPTLEGTCLARTYVYSKEAVSKKADEKKKDAKDETKSQPTIKK